MADDDLGFEPHAAGKDADLGFEAASKGPGAASRAAGSFYDSTIGGIVDTLKQIGWAPSKEARDAYANGDWHAVVKDALQTALPGANIAINAAKSSYQQGKQALAQAQAGQYGQAAISAVGAVPLVGPMAQKPIQQFASGDVAGGLGTTAGTALMLAGPEALKAGLAPEAVRLAPGIASGSLDPAEAAAVRFGEAQNIPMTAATRTNNPVVQAVQKMASTAPLTGVKRAIMREQQALAETGANLTEQAHPLPTTPEFAGGDVQAAFKDRIKNLSDDAKNAYDSMARRESDPRNIKTVQTGTKTITSPILDAQGNPQTITQPITEQMGLPVDARDAKAGLQPLYDSLKKEMPIAQQQSSMGLKALENIITGPDFVPASVADQNLSAMKAIQRENVSAKARYLAAKAIDQYSPAVDKAVAEAGPQATQELQSARDLWKAKAATQDTLDNLRTEPVQLVRQLTASKDAGINLLRDVESKVPNALPAVGRAYLEGLMQKAFGEAGTAKPGSVLTEWNNLGPSTKSLLFKNPLLRQNLDDFFTLAKKAAENPNPSGTATTAQIGTDGGMLVTAPHVAIPYIIGRTALSRLLLSQTGAKALADGLRIPIRNPAASSIAAGRILKLAGADAVPATGQ